MRTRDRLRYMVLDYLKSKNIYVTRQAILNNLQLFNFIHHNLVRHGSVLHIGAHEGQESAFYRNLGVEVLWIEAQRSIFETLSENIKDLDPSQRAICALLGDVDRGDVPFYISNNEAVSSSIFKFGREHRWTGVEMSEVISLDMHRLDSVLEPDQLIGFSHCVLDVQGAELLVLKGFGALLENFRSFEIEVSTMETYSGGVQFESIAAFMRNYGFYPLWNPQKFVHENLIFLRKDIFYVMQWV